MTRAIEGVHCAVATPVDAAGTPQTRLLVEHCKALLNEGCHGLAPLGTTGEANNFGVSQRMELIEALVEGGIDAATMIPGTGALSVADTIERTAHSVRCGAKGALVLPPFYYKDPDPEGLFRFYARVIEGVGDDRLRLVLYHIPQMSMVPIGHDLIERLMAAFPGIVCGIKDSSGSLENMVEMCRHFPDLSVLSGADPLMLPVLQAGGAGCITAASNLGAQALRTVWDSWQEPGQADAVAAAQEKIIAWRTLTTSYAQIPTTKALIARLRGDLLWTNLLPPFVEIGEAERADVWAKMDELRG